MVFTLFTRISSKTKYQEYKVKWVVEVSKDEIVDAVNNSNLPYIQSVTKEA